MLKQKNFSGAGGGVDRDETDISELADAAARARALLEQHDKDEKERAHAERIARTERVAAEREAANKEKYKKQQAELRAKRERARRSACCGCCW